VLANAYVRRERPRLTCALDSAAAEIVGQHPRRTPRLKSAAVLSESFTYYASDVRESLTELVDETEFQTAVPEGGTAEKKSGGYGRFVVIVYERPAIFALVKEVRNGAEPWTEAGRKNRS
jgi:hypothetical protein